MKILILMSFYQRPILVRRALRSILRAAEHHDDWELVFGDDGSATPGRPIAEEILKGHLDRVTFVHTGMTFEDKIAAGLVLGRHCNEAIRRSAADLGIMFCDDDELCPTYLKDIAAYFAANPAVWYCYSKIHVFNPLFQKTEDVDNLSNKYNRWSGPIDPVNKVDASQVAWRLACCTARGAWFADSTKAVAGKPWARDTDKGFFESLHEKCGPCHESGCVAQYKGVHDYQLLWHKNVDEDGLRAYDEMIAANAGGLL